MRRFGSHISNRRDKVLRDEEDMGRRFGVDIFEREDFVVFGDDCRRDGTGKDLMEDGLFSHRKSIDQSIGEFRCGLTIYAKKGTIEK